MRLVMMTISLLLLGTQAGRVRSWDFDDLTEGTLPGGWKAEATGQDRAISDARVHSYE